MLETITQFIGLLAMLGLLVYVFLPSSMKPALHTAGNMLMSISVDLIEMIYWCFAFCNGVLHIIGRLLTSLLLATATFILCQEVWGIFSNPALSSEKQYLALRTLFTQPYTWAAATTIVATTVAIANIRKYHLDRDEAKEKWEERREKRALEREKQNKERREAKKAIPSAFR